jgi:hypothetical protein
VKEKGTYSGDLDMGKVTLKRGDLNNITNALTKDVRVLEKSGKMTEVEGELHFRASRDGSSWKALNNGGGIEEGLSGNDAGKAQKVPNQLVVKIISAAKLKAVDRGGTSDPFVILKCGGKTFRTGVKQKDLNPKWGETFKFPLAADNMPANTQLELTVKDSNMLTTVFLGKVSFDVIKTFGGDNALKEVKKTYTLKNKTLTADAQGTLDVSVQWTCAKPDGAKDGKKKGVFAKGVSVFTTNTLSRFKAGDTSSDDSDCGSDDEDEGVEAEDAVVRY